MRIESRGGGTGRRTGFKIRRPCGREGSTPSFGTKQDGDDFLRRRVAQLAERCLDMAEVTGSNPVAPTTSAKTAIKHPAAKTLKIKTPRIAGPGRLRSVWTFRVQRLLPQHRPPQKQKLPRAEQGRGWGWETGSGWERVGVGGSGSGRKIFFCGGILRYNWGFPSRISHFLILNSCGGEI